MYTRTHKLTRKSTGSVSYFIDIKVEILSVKSGLAKAVALKKKLKEAIIVIAHVQLKHGSAHVQLMHGSAHVQLKFGSALCDGSLAPRMCNKSIVPSHVQLKLISRK